MIGDVRRAIRRAVWLATLAPAVAARIEGSVVHEVTRPARDPGAPIRIGMPSGVMVAAASVRNASGQWQADQGGFLRTQRRLFDGHPLMKAMHWLSHRRRRNSRAGSRRWPRRCRWTCAPTTRSG